MARWQLTEPHYLNVPGAVFEDKTSGDRKAKKLPVPTLIDPNQELDWNYREMVAPNVVDGKVIVCHVGKGEPRDIEFIGDPTPGMLPLDDEARAISAKFKWTPTQGLDDLSQAESFTQRLLMGMFTDMTEVKAQVQASSSVEGMSELMRTLAEMMKMQTKLLAAISGKAIPPAEPPIANPELQKFTPQGRGPTNLRDMRKLVAQAKPETELTE